MSKRLDDLIRRFVDLGQNLQEAQAQALNEQAELAKTLNQEQLSEGRRSDNTRLPPYSPKTVAIKSRLGQQTSPMNLRNKGDFWNSIKFTAADGVLEGEATDRKSGLIFDAFGSNVVGLTPANIRKVSNGAKKSLEKIIKTFLRG